VGFLSGWLDGWMVGWFVICKVVCDGDVGGEGGMRELGFGGVTEILGKRSGYHGGRSQTVMTVIDQGSR